MNKRVFNFNAGPATLPLEVLKQVQDEILCYAAAGASVLELSHRSKDYEAIQTGAAQLVRELLAVGDDYHILFLGGGASTQFAMIPMNFLKAQGVAAYVDTGSWSSKAIKEAKKIGNVHIAGSSKDDNYSFIPTIELNDLPDNASYLHLTSNNTIFGTQYSQFPDSGEIPLICDMSSDILSRKLDFEKFSLIYAGAQKNMGPAGVTIVIVQRQMLEKCRDGNPTMLDYRTHADTDSLYNTPPVFSIYVVKLVLEWIKRQGGIKAVEVVNLAKQERIYQMIDLHADYYRGTARADSRSWMNITFRLPSEDLEKKFIAEAAAAGMVGLKGHRSVGGVRVSLYNAMTLAGAERVAEFMEEFRQKNS